MSVRKLIATRNLFINTDQSPNGDGRSVRYNLPQGVMMCNENQTMRVTLSSFNMRQGWYRINRYNNVFYVVGIKTDGVTIGAVRIKLDEGDYHAFDSPVEATVLDAPSVPPGTALQDLARVSLKHQIEYQLHKAAQPAGAGNQLYENNFATAGTKPTVDFDNLQKKYTITLHASETGDPGVPNYTKLKLVAFYISDYRKSDPENVVDKIVGANTSDVFQNSFEILGGCAETRLVVPGNTIEEQYDALQQLFSVNNPPGTSQYQMTSDYKATLQSEECVYLRTNLQSSNYQTTGFDTGGTRTPEIQPSQIFAKIPLNNPVFAVTDSQFTTDAGAAVPNVDAGKSITTYQRPYEFLNYEDNGNNLYSLMLDAKKVTYLELRLTDSYGRVIPEASIEQLRCKAMSFSCDLRIDVFQEVPLRVVPMDVGVPP
jgi:hypothetical protein